MTKSNLRHSWRRRLGGAGLIALLTIQVACGTFLYPERRGQSEGQLDTDIVILDAIGLLFFIIPGVIAFAVDFSTGAIYLPTGESSRTSEIFGAVERHPFTSEFRNPARLAAWLESETGLQVELADALVIRVEDGPSVDLERKLLELHRFAKRQRTDIAIASSGRR